MAESELTTIARPYARAAFSQALDEASGLANWSRMLGLLANVVQQPGVRSALDNPLLTTEDEAKLVIVVMGEELSPKGQNFVTVLAENGRISLMPKIAELYELFRSNHEKTMDVQITSAYEVDEADEQKLAAALKQRLQREINLSSIVDPTLLGGVVIKAEDTVIDNSVRGKLQKLSRVLS
ncbi:MAG: F0F1 ATP synthase subunit delta [bacterium]|nr:F0F1 ATP synthase subunit delta [Gammaproteobacteria bacterium]HIL95167.1 F0F1 ATP synthase subunit delta [Pseudomonadales bacterium]